MNGKTINFLIGVTLFFKTIPILGSSLLPFAPINIISLISLGYIIIHKDRFAKIIQSKQVLSSLSFFLIYYIFIYIFGILGYGAKPNIVLLVQNLIFFILVVQLDWASIKQTLRIYVFLLFIELFISLMIYFIGEPFATFRLALIDNPDYFYIGEHQRIAGFQRTVFLYAYPAAILPLLTLIYFYSRNRFLSILLIIIAYFGIVINGERISLILSSAGFIILFFLISKRGIQLSYFVLFIIIIVFLNSQLSVITKSEHGIERMNELSSEEMSQRMSKQWIGVRTVLSSPLTPANMDKYNELSVLKFGTQVSSPHNQFVNVGLNAGIFGWIIFGVFILYMVKLALKIKKATRNLKTSSLIQMWSILNFAFWISLGVGFFHNAGIFDFENTQFTLFCYLTGVSCLIIREIKKGRSIAAEKILPQPVAGVKNISVSPENS